MSFTVASGAALWETRHAPAALLVSLCVLGLLELAVVILRLGAPLQLMAMLGGGYLIAYRTGLPGPPWVRVLVVGVTALGALALRDADRRSEPSCSAPLLLTVSIAGLVATVPDPDWALTLLGSLVPLAALSWPWRRASLGQVGSGMAVALFAWSTAVGGRGRLAAIIGGLGCLGLLLAEPLGRLVGRRRLGLLGISVRPTSVLLLIVLQAVTTYIASRIAGLGRDVSRAALIVGGDLVAATAVAALTRRRRDATTSGRLLSFPGQAAGSR